MRFGKIRTSGRTEKISTSKNHIMAQGYSSIIITSNIQRLGNAGDDRRRSKVQTLLLQRSALRKFYVTDGQNTGDKITKGKRVKTRVIMLGSAHSCSFLVAVQINECCLHTCDACVTRTWRLELRAPLVARNNFIPFHGWLFNVTESISNIINISTIKI